jgi:4-diphosphocytidyl-2-C-methyl-D-erythritol kinase
MIRYPPAKINLGLSVTRRRADGYHDIETVFVPIPLSDILEIIPSTQSGIRLSTSGMAIPEGPNLIEKAFDLVQKEFGILGAEAHLHKRIPMGAGLGGGSADGAYALRMLKDIFELPGSDFWHQAAVKLGADCAFFLQEAPMSASGIGEILSPVKLDLDGLGLVFIHPGVHVSTAEAYQAIMPNVPEFLPKDVVKMPRKHWKEKLVNDFEEPVFRKYPLLKEIKERLYGAGAVYAAMSGSGSTLFGLFEGQLPDFKSIYPSYFIYSSRL